MTDPMMTRRMNVPNRSHLPVRFADVREGAVFTNAASVGSYYIKVEDSAVADTPHGRFPVGPVDPDEMVTVCFSAFVIMGAGTKGNVWFGDLKRALQMLQQYEDATGEDGAVNEIAQNNVGTIIGTGDVFYTPIKR